MRILAAPILLSVVLAHGLPCRAAETTTTTITTASMPTVVFTGDSQSCGRGLAIDFPQLVSHALPARVFNTAVGGSNSDALLHPMTGGTARATAGSDVIDGQGVKWGAGPFPGQTVVIAGERYTIDHVDEFPKEKRVELHLTEPAHVDYEGTDHQVEPGWDVRVARYQPDVVCWMFINDGDMSSAKQENWRKMIRRTRELGAVPVLMSPVPVDGVEEGGVHPSNNGAKEAAAGVAAELARAQRCWFIDVYRLYRALDPTLRGVARDGIHPDTDGVTLVVNALHQIFEQMGLHGARPFIKGWVVEGEDASLPQLLDGGARPLRIAQPDHPDAETQDEAGFTLEALRRNDEYGLIEAADGESLAIGRGLVFRVGLPADHDPAKVVLRWNATESATARVWLPGEAAWHPLPAVDADGWEAAAIPPEAVEDGLLHVGIGEGSAGAALDGLAVDVVFDAAVADAAAAWQPSDVKPSAYSLASDHNRAGNLVSNPAFSKGKPEDAQHWVLGGDAAVNCPWKAPLKAVSFTDEKDKQLVVLAGGEAARPFDWIQVPHSTKGNGGLFRIRSVADDGTVHVRRRRKAVEFGMRGTLHHDDGCGFVAGGCNVEVRGEGIAQAEIALPDGEPQLHLSLFHRVYDPEALGSRDVPGREARVTVTFRDAAGSVGEPWVSDELVGSYQWQKAVWACPIPAGSTSAVVELGSRSGQAIQYTGVYAGKAP